MSCEMVTTEIPMFLGPSSYPQHHTPNGLLEFTLYKQTGNEESYSAIFLRQINSLSPGFGTQAYRRLTQASFNQGTQGRVIAFATFSSHLFHLKMGMMPRPKQISALAHFLNLSPYDSGHQAKTSFKKIVEKVNSKTELTEPEEALLKIYKQILTLSEERVDQQRADALKRKAFLARHHEVLSTTVSSLWYECLAPILTSLEKAIHGERPITWSLGHLLMEMSDAGISRWKADIEGSAPFVPFRQFEHLHASLFPWQRELLERGLAEARARSVWV